MTASHPQEQPGPTTNLCSFRGGRHQRRRAGPAAGVYLILSSSKRPDRLGMHTEGSLKHGFSEAKQEIHPGVNCWGCSSLHHHCGRTGGPQICLVKAKLSPWFGKGSARTQREMGRSRSYMGWKGCVSQTSREEPWKARVHCFGDHHLSLESTAVRAPQ